MSAHEVQGLTTSKRWTVMLYMAATVDNQPVEPTEQAAINDLTELEKVGSTPQVNVVVHVHRRWPLYGERYCVRKGFSELVTCFPDPKELNPENLDLFEKFPKVDDREELCVLTKTKNYEELRSRFKHRDPKVLQTFFGTGNPAVLQDFVTWTKKAFPADHYLLVLWGHAYGLGFGRDHHDPLTVPELGRALEDFNLDILGANACAMSYAEAAYELGVKQAAKFMVASEITMPFQGWPYEKILKRIDLSPDIQPEDLGKAIIDDFMDSFGGNGVSLTMLDLSKVSGLADQIIKLAGPLDDAIKSQQPEFSMSSDRAFTAKLAETERRRKGPADQVDEKVKQLAVKLKEAQPLVGPSQSIDGPNGANHQIEYLSQAFDQAVRERTATQVRFAFQDTAHSGDVRPLIDLADLCDRLAECRDDTVKNAATGLRATLEPGKGLIVEHRRDANFDGLNGLGIYAPAITNGADLKRLELDDQASYGKLALFAADNKWKKVVYDGLQQLLEPTRTGIANFVSGTGAASPEDVAAVGQLTAGVFRAFEKLEQALASTELTVLGDEGRGNGHSRPGPAAFKSALAGIPFNLDSATRGQLAARLAPPFLRLVGPFSSNGNGYHPGRVVRGKSVAKQMSDLFDDVVMSMRAFEGVLADAERTVTKALTNATFGVSGPPKSGEGPPKSGEGPPKSGEGPPKSGEGPPKSGEGIFPPILSSVIDIGELRGAVEMKSVTALYEQVALSFRKIETLAEKLEEVLRTVLTDPAVSIDRKSREQVHRYRDYAESLVQQSLRELEQMVTDAQRTTIEVATHPVFGLGPGPSPGLGAARQRLAGVAGLSPRFLRLM